MTLVMCGNKWVNLDHIVSIELSNEKLLITTTKLVLTPAIATQPRYVVSEVIELTGNVAQRFLGDIKSNQYGN